MSRPAGAGHGSGLGGWDWDGQGTEAGGKQLEPWELAAWLRSLVLTLGWAEKQPAAASSTENQGVRGYSTENQGVRGHSRGSVGGLSTEGRQHAARLVLQAAMQLPLHEVHVPVLTDVLSSLAHQGVR